MPLQVAAVLSLAMKCLVVMYVERIQQFRRDFSVCVIPIIIEVVVVYYYFLLFHSQNSHVSSKSEC